MIEAKIEMIEGEIMLGAFNGYDTSELATAWKELMVQKEPHLISQDQKCSKCGIVFEAGKVYGYSCNRTGCPFFMNVVS